MLGPGAGGVRRSYIWMGPISVLLLSPFRLAAQQRCKSQFAVLAACALLRPNVGGRLGGWGFFVSSPPQNISTRHSVTLDDHSAGFVLPRLTFDSGGFGSPANLNPLTTQ